MFSAGFPVIELPAKFQFQPVIPSSGVEVTSENTAFLVAQRLATEKLSVGGTGTLIVLLFTLLQALTLVTLRVTIKSPVEVKAYVGLGVLKLLEPICHSRDCTPPLDVSVNTAL